MAMKYYQAMLLAMVAVSAGDAMAGPLDIPQVKAQEPRANGAKSAEAPAATEDENAARVEDHQSAVLNNAAISDYGRASAFTHFNETGQGQGGANIAIINQDAKAHMDESQLGGENIAIINQDGASNSSTIIQNGKNNVAKQVQKGESNDIYLNQQGDNNVSSEIQKGKKNRKTKVQNGKTTVTEESPVKP